MYDVYTICHCLLIDQILPLSKIHYTKLRHPIIALCHIPVYVTTKFQVDMQVLCLLGFFPIFEILLLKSSKYQNAFKLLQKVITMVVYSRDNCCRFNNISTNKCEKIKYRFAHSMQPAINWPFFSLCIQKSNVTKYLL